MGIYIAYKKIYKNLLGGGEAKIDFCIKKNIL